jgi:16S rRNA (cytosine1402-N4)-methyltransferase
VIAMDPVHKPVLLERAVDQLVWRPGVYVDGTFGGGGHTREILDRDRRNRVIAFDRDHAALERGERLQSQVGADRLILIHDNFSALAVGLDDLGIEQVDGILLDLGLSSYQLDDAERGFAFRFEGPLDMRFDQSTGSTVADLIATVDETELANLIWRYGDERRSRQIARAVVAERERRSIETTG